MLIDLIIVGFLFVLLIEYFLIQKFDYFFGFYSFKFHSLIIFGAFGAISIYLGFGKDLYFIKPIYNNNDVIHWGTIATLWSIIGPFMVVIILEYPRRFKFGSRTQHFQYDVISVRKIHYAYLKVLVLTTGLYYLYTIHPSPLFLAFTGEPSDVSIRKFEILTNYGGIGVLRTIAVVSAQILLSMLIMKNKLLHFQISDVIWYIFIFLIVSSSAEKGAIINCLLIYFISNSILGNKLSFKAFLFIVCILVLAISFLYRLFMDAEFNFFGVLLERIFVAQVIAVYLSFDYFHDGNFLGLSSMDSSIFRSFQFEHSLRASEMFVSKYYPGMEAIGTVNVNGIYIHEAYSNFGLMGVVFGPLLCGMGLVMLYRLLVPFRADVMSVYRLSFACYMTVDTVSVLTSFNQMLFNTKALLVLILFYIGLALSEVLK